MNKVKELFNKVWPKTQKGLIWFFKSFIWIFLILFGLDLLTKILALNHFGGWELFNKSESELAYIVSQKSITVIPGFFSVSFTLNTGAAWGIFGGLPDVARRGILISISLIMSIAFVVAYIIKFKKLNLFYKGILMALLAGALGNFIDRAFYPSGKVIDFMQFTFMNFPVFNFADAVLVITIVVVVIYIIVTEIIAYVKKKKASETNTNSDNINGEIVEPKKETNSLNDEIVNETKDEQNKD